MGFTTEKSQTFLNAVLGYWATARKEKDSLRVQQFERESPDVLPTVPVLDFWGNLPSVLRYPRCKVSHHCIHPAPSPTEGSLWRENQVEAQGRSGGGPSINFHPEVDAQGVLVHFTLSGV